MHYSIFILRIYFNCVCAFDVVAPPINNGNQNFDVAFLSLNTPFHLSDGVIKPLKPIASTRSL